MANAYTRAVRAAKRLPGARALLALVPDRPVTRDVPGLGSFRFRLRRQRWLLGDEPMGGTHADMLRTFRLLMPARGGVLYDVGANIGYYARLALRELDPAAVVCVEPMADNFALLSANVALGPHAERVTLLKLALAEARGEESLQADDTMGGSAALDRVAEDHARLGRVDAARRETVETWPLDQLVRERGLPTPSVVKIDVEGAEALVLAGARETIAAARPRMAVSLHGPRPAADCYALWRELDYRVFEVPAGTSDLVPAPEVPSDLHDNNVVALHVGDELARCA